MEKKMDILKWIKRWICVKLEKKMDIQVRFASKAFIPRSAWQRASGGAVVDRRRQGYGFASRLSDEKSLPHRPLIVKRLSRHKRCEYIALADPRDEKDESFTKATRYTNILVPNQENNPFVRKKDCFPETTQKCSPYCNRTPPYGYIFCCIRSKVYKKFIYSLVSRLVFLKQHKNAP